MEGQGEVLRVPAAKGRAFPWDGTCGMICRPAKGRRLCAGPPCGCRLFCVVGTNESLFSLLDSGM